MVKLEYESGVFTGVVVDELDEPIIQALVKRDVGIRRVNPHGLTQELANRLRVVRMGAQLAPRSVQPYPVTTDGLIFDNEAANLVAAGRGLLVHAPQNGVQAALHQP